MQTALNSAFPCNFPPACNKAGTVCKSTGVVLTAPGCSASGGSGSNSGGNSGGGGYRIPGPIYGPSLLEAYNPNIIEQADDWRNERWANGQDPRDWNAFRQHEIGIGAPDPGPNPLSGWNN